MSRGAARRVGERVGVRRRRAGGGQPAYFGGGRYSDDDVADEAAPWHAQQARLCPTDYLGHCCCSPGIDLLQTSDGGICPALPSKATQNLSLERFMTWQTTVCQR